MFSLNLPKIYTMRAILLNRRLVRLWLVLAVLALGSLVDVMEFALHDASSNIAGALAVAGLACVVVLKASVLTAVYASCRRRLWLRLFAISLIIAFVLLSLLNGFSWLFYGFGITRKLFIIMVETNPTEVGEFMPELLDKFRVFFCSGWFWMSIAIFSLAWFGLPCIAGRWMFWTALSLSVVGSIYLIYIFTTAPFGRANHSVFLRAGRCVAAFMRDRDVIRQLQTMKRPLAHPESLTSTKAAERIVVVIGESASRSHLSLYGYPLPTTPRMDTVSVGLYRFDDAVASSTATAENIPRLISFMTDEPSSGEWYEYSSLLQIFHRLGYKTYWLSNQEYTGTWSNLSSILSSDADVVKYVGSMDSDDHYLYRYDDALLPEWESTLASGDSLQLTFLHLMGSHFQYHNRYPKSQKRFSASDIMANLPRKWLDAEKADIVACYDNSILYTDSILSIVADDIRKSDIPTVMIYVADHGENVYDDRDYRGRDPKFVKVPFIVYANEAYRKKNPGIISDIENSLLNSFSTSELPQMLMHLSGTRYEMYDSVRDPISPSFRPRQRYIDEEKY